MSTCYLQAPACALEPASQGRLLMIFEVEAPNSQDLSADCAIYLELETNSVVVPLLSRVRLFATPWTAARQASLSITNSRSLLKLMSIESVMPSSHLILCRPLLLLPPIPPSVRDFSNVLRTELKDMEEEMVRRSQSQDTFWRRFPDDFHLGS